MQTKPAIRSLLRVKLTKRMKEVPGSLVAVGGADIFGPHIDDAKSHLGGTQWWQRWLRAQETNLSGFVRVCHIIHDDFLLFERLCQCIVRCFERGESAAIDGSFLDLSTLHPQQIVP